MKYASTPDGLSWQTFTVTSCVYGYKFSVAYNDTAVWYALVNGTVNVPILYRQGVFNGGQIVWSDEQIAVSPANEYIQFNYPNIIIDSSGYAFIAYFAKHVETGELWLNVTKNAYAYSSNWQTDSNFPYMFEHNAGEGGVGVTHLGNGKLAFVYLCGATLNHIYYVVYNGSVFNKVDWIDESLTGTGELLTSTQMFSVSSYQNALFITYMTKTGSPFNVKNAYTDLTSDPTMVGTTLASSAYPSIAVQGYKNVIFYVYSNSIEYSVGIPTEGSAWNVYTWFSETSGTYIRALSSFKTANSENVVGVAYVKQYDLSSQYEVKFAGLYVQPYAKIWQVISSWIFNALSRMWQSICEWSYNVFSQAWRDLVYWLFSLHSIGWSNIAWWFVLIYTEITVIITPVIKWGMVFSLAVVFAVALALMFEDGKKK
jgi:hypothetical protein